MSSPEGGDPIAPVSRQSAAYGSPPSLRLFPPCRRWGAAALFDLLNKRNPGGHAMIRLCAALLYALAPTIATPVLAQDYPNRPIRVIVTTSPGGISDVF